MSYNLQLINTNYQYYQDGRYQLLMNVFSPQEEVNLLGSRSQSTNLVIFILPNIHWASKKLITLSERHSIKSRTWKWIIIRHRLAIVLLTEHIKKKTFDFKSKKCIKWGEIARGHSSKITETIRLPARARSPHGQYPMRRLHKCNPPLKLNE